MRSNKWWWRIGFDANIQQVEVADATVPVEKYFLGRSYFYTLGSLFNHGLYFNVGLGSLLGYEQVNNGNHLVNEAIRLEDKREICLWFLSPVLQDSVQAW